MPSLEENIAALTASVTALAAIVANHGLQVEANTIAMDALNMGRSTGCTPVYQGPLTGTPEAPAPEPEKVKAARPKKTAEPKLAVVEPEPEVTGFVDTPDSDPAPEAETVESEIDEDLEPEAEPAEDYSKWDEGKLRLAVQEVAKNRILEADAANDDKGREFKAAFVAARASYKVDKVSKLSFEQLVEFYPKLLKLANQ